MSFANTSPWIEQLDSSMDFPALSGNTKTDVVVIGAGIAGISTAYQILQQTELSVVVVEAKQIARGATGHNAGQVVLYFERPFQDIVREYGLEMAVEGQKSLFRGFDILEEMAIKNNMSEQFETCEGFMGVRTVHLLLQHLQNKYLRDTGGAQFDAVFVDKNWDKIGEIPPEFQSIITLVESEFIERKLETTEYFPVMMTSKKACVNSALFCQKSIQYMIKHFPHRFNLYEHSPVAELRMLPDRLNEVCIGDYHIKTDEVILCTNGFDKFHIVDLHQSNSRDTDKNFHKNVHGLVGYMAGFLAPRGAPSAISYYPDEEKKDWQAEQYFYVTRRTFGNPVDNRSLICVGGPDNLVPAETHYDAETNDPKESYQQIHTFLHKYRPENVPEKFPYAWHGLMGYTHTGLRYIGQSPKTPHLWYNLGCNGAGIVSSVFGGWKIAKVLSGHSFPRSIFDPQ